MKMLSVLLPLVLLSALLLASPTCPEDGSGAYFTGRTRTSDSGKLMKEYRCNRYSHLFWASDN